MVSEQRENVERGAFLDAIEALLRPLMPVVLSYGVGAEEIGEIFKVLYLEVLADRLKSQGRPATVARLALMAGLPKGQTQALLTRRIERREQRARDTHKLDRLSRVLSAWHDDSRFSTPYGAPLDLSLDTEKGFRSFGDLVEASQSGLDSSLVLDELLAAGCVEVHADKFVRCINRVFIPTGVDASRITRMGRFVGAMNSTFAHNLLRSSEEPSYYERALVTDGRVRREFRDEALNHLNTNMQPVIEQLDRWFLSKEQEYTDPDGVMFGVCTFFYEEQGPNSAAIEAERVVINAN